MLEFYSAITLVMVMSVVVMIIHLADSKLLNASRRGWFIVAFSAALIALISEWGGEMLNGASESTVIWHAVLKCLEYTATPMLPILLARAIGRKQYFRFACTGAALNAVLEVLSIWTGLVFRITPQNTYSNGKFYFLYIFFYAASVIYALASYYVNSKKYKHRHGAVLIGLFITLATGVIIQEIYPSIKICWITICAVVFILYLYYTELYSQGLDLDRQRQASMARVLAEECDRMSMINIRTGQMTIYIFGDDSETTMVQKQDYNKIIRNYAETVVYEADREKFLEDIALEKILSELENRKSYVVSFRIITEYGPQFYEIKSARDIIDGDDFIVCGFRNTDQRMREVLMRQAELSEAKEKAEAANRIKSEFIERISGDIRTPITGAISMIELARKNITNVRSAREYLDKAIGSSERLLVLVNDMMDMNAIDNEATEVRHEPMNVAAAFGNCAYLMSQQLEGTGIRMVSSFERFANPFVLGDEDKLKQALMHILEITAGDTPESRNITFSAEEVTSGDTTVLYRFKVSDSRNGSGESRLKEDWDYLLSDNVDNVTIFSNANLMAMTIVKRHATLMGGTVEFAADEKGVSFTLEVPFAIDDKRVAKISEEKGLKESIRGTRILVIEDNEINSEFTKEMLEQEGAEVVLAGNGREGVDIFEKSGLNYFDAILMDIIMPEIDGLEASRMIRAMKRADAEDVPIIAMTGDSKENAARLSLDAGMNAHLQKPLVVSELAKTLMFCIRNRSVQLAERLERALVMATKDSLTGVRNRTAYDRICQQINEEITNGCTTPFAMVVCDINGLKNVNDNVGHEFGDKLIISVCKVICDVFKRSPVFRIGGDEFVAILRGEDYEKRAYLMSELQNRERYGGIHISFAAGISEFIPGEDIGAENVFERADTAMYNNKREMKNAGEISSIPVE